VQLVGHLYIKFSIKLEKNIAGIYTFLRKFMAMAQAISCWSFAMDALGLNSRSAYAEFLLQKVALGQV